MSETFDIPTGSELRELSRQRIAQLEATVEGLRERAEQAEAERDAARAELERVRGERDALIAAWPNVNAANYVYQTRGAWYTRDDHKQPHPTREAAVRAAAGLAPHSPELTLAERNAVVAGVASAVRAAAGLPPAETETIHHTNRSTDVR